MEMVIKYEALVFRKEDGGIIFSDLRETEKEAQRLVEEKIKGFSEKEKSFVEGRVVRKYIM